MQPKITIKTSCISCRTKVLDMYHCYPHNIRYKSQSFYEVKSPRIWSWKKKGISIPKDGIEGASEMVKKLEFAVWRKKKICVDASTFFYFCQPECECCRLLVANLNKMKKKKTTFFAVKWCNFQTQTKSSRLTLLQSVVLMNSSHKDETKVRQAAFYKKKI